ncbi:MAG: sensor histidine kinase [Burkholderiales bacterium]|nr:sensor histidine kinase [Burkholderiales bacterium]
MPPEGRGLPARLALPRSIRARLLLWLSLPLVVFLAIDAWANYSAALRTAQLAFDRLLVTSTHALADLIRLERGQLVISLPHAALEIYDHVSAAAEPGELETRGRMLYRVGFLDGAYLAGDRELPAYTARPPSHPVYRSMIELYDSRSGPEPMRMAALLQPVESFDGARLVVVQVAESSAYRDALARRILLETLVRQAVLLVVVLALIWVVATLALKPLTLLAARLDARSAHDLTPLAPAPVPSELTPVVGGFDGLLARLAHAQEQQRRFVADASHQLRTPLTVLQLQAESGLRGDVPAQEALASVAATTQRATRLAEQLLSLAKAQQTAATEAPQDADLREIASEAAVELSPLIAAKYLDFRFECEPCTASTHRWMVREIVANLLKNAIEFTPDHGVLGIRTEFEGGSPALVVWDSGPGLSDAMKEQVFTPFATDRPSRGAGLGLAICRDLASALGASLQLANRGGAQGGLQARLVMPPAPPPPPRP